MNTKRVSPKKIQISIDLDISSTELFGYLTEPYKMRLWLADSVQKTPKGFDLEINLLMHTIENQATILKKEPPKIFEYLWNSEYVMDQSVVTFKLKEKNDHTALVITEVGDFDESRWSDPQEIHIDLWSKALQRLEKII